MASAAVSPLDTPGLMVGWCVHCGGFLNRHAGSGWAWFHRGGKLECD